MKYKITFFCINELKISSYKTRSNVSQAQTVLVPIKVGIRYPLIHDSDYEGDFC